MPHHELSDLSPLRVGLTITLVLLSACSSSVGAADPGSTEQPKPSVLQFRSAGSAAHEDSQEVQQAVVEIVPAAPEDLVVPFSVSFEGVVNPVTPDLLVLSDSLSGGERLFVPAGASEVVLELRVEPDTYYENDERVVLALVSAPEGAQLGGRSTYEHVILDDDPVPEVSFALDAMALGEANGTAFVPIRIDPEAGRTLELTIAVDEIGGISAADYSLETSLSVEPHAMQGRLALQLEDDDVFEGAEGLVLHLLNAGEAHLVEPLQVSVAVVDDEGLPKLSLGSHVHEWDEGDGVVSIPVVLSASLDEQLEVDFALGGTALEGVDYEVLTPGPLVIEPGTKLSSIDLRLLPDTLHEAQEALLIELLPPADPSLAQLEGSGAAATELAILDDDAPPAVAFALASIELLEGSGPLAVSVELVGTVAGRETRVHYEVIPDSAEQQLDFVLTGDEFVVLEGEHSAQIEIEALSDGLDEAELESLRLRLTYADHAELAQPTELVVHIRDIDVLPTLGLQAPDGLTLGEGGGSLELVARLDAVSDKDVEVSLDFSGSTATPGVDFTLQTPMPLVIAAGTLEAGVVLSAIPDDTFEGSEEILVSLANPVHAEIGGAASVLLIDDESLPTVTLLQSELSLSESAGSIVLDVELSHPSKFQVSASVTHQGSSSHPALTPADYVLTTTGVVFSPGSEQAEIEVAIVPDTDDEPDESFQVSLQGVSGATLGASPTVAITVIDDDETVPFFADGGFESQTAGSSPQGAWSVAGGSGHRVRDAVVPATRVFWAESSTGVVRHADMNGDDPIDAVIGTVLGPLSLGIDESKQRLMWLTYSFPGPIAMNHANLDGTGQVTGPDIQLGPGVGAFHDVVFNKAADRVFWCVSHDYGGGRILSTDTFGMDVETHVELADYPRSMAFDSIGGRMYWASYGGLHRADLDGSAVETIATKEDFNPKGPIAIDTLERKVYWISGAEWGDVMERANLDGSDRELVLAEDSGATLPSSLVGSMAIDLEKRHVYWTHPAGIGRATLEGGDIQEFVGNGQVFGSGIEHEFVNLFPSTDRSDHGMPREGRQWVELESSPVACGEPAGIEQTFKAPTGQTLLALDTVVLAHPDTFDGRLVVTLGDGASAETILTRTMQPAELLHDSYLHPGYRASELETTTVDLAEVFPDSTSSTVYTLSIQVSACGGSEPARAFIDDVRLELGNVPAVASFSLSAEGGVAPLAVELTDASTGSITDRTWMIDGIAVDPFPGVQWVATFDDPGVHDVTLSVSGPAGAPSSMSRSIDVVEPLVAAFSVSPSTGIDGTQFEFFNSTTGYDFGSSDYSVEWSFGSDGTSSLYEPKHTFSGPGSYLVRLTVEGPYGLEDKATQTVQVLAAAPVASFTLSPQSGVAPLHVTFTNESANYTSALWDLGTGSFQQISSTQFSKTFFAPGTYSIVLKVEGPGGGDTQTKTVQVQQGFEGVWDILAAKCASCHTSTSVLPFVSPQGAHGAMVNEKASCNNKTLVTPGSPSGSFLVDKLDPKPTFNGSFLGQVFGQWKWTGSSWSWNGCGSAMPAVSSSQLELIQQWILDGAQPPQ